MEIIYGISCNPALPWPVKLIRKHLGKWFWFDLSHNEGIPWSLEIINEFHDHWEWDNLTWNTVMWEKLFYPY